MAEPSRSAPRGVRNASQLDRFGYWPTFHDAEIHRVELDRSGPGGEPSATFVVHVFDHTGELDEDGYFRRRVSVLVTLRFEDVRDLRLEAFGVQNVLAAVAIESEADRHAVVISPSYGLDCAFTCAAVEIVDVAPYLRGQLSPRRQIGTLPGAARKSLAQARTRAG